jgi:hypothetical protein
MRYMAAYRYAFNSPNWVTNVLLGVASLFVPIVGPIVFTGYLFESMEKMRRSGEEKPCDVDLNCLVPYLMRGVWPFLVHLVVGLPAGLIASVLGLVSLFLSIAVFSAANSPATMVVGVVVGYLLFFFWVAVINCLANMVIVPMVIRAAYHMDFGSAFEMAFLKDFYRRVGKELIVSQLFLAASAVVLGIAGLLVCIVGFYFVVPVIHYAQCHIMYQLLTLYEERGGMPISFKPYEPKPAG